MKKQTYPNNHLILDDMTNQALPDKEEVLIIIIIFLSGFALRIWNISDVGLDHFDEGVYAFSGLGLTDPTQPLRLYPTQEQASPPIFIGLVGLSYIIAGGPSDKAIFILNGLLGSFTVLLLWWVGRSWFNVPVGIAAATLLALSEYHISLSRTGLSDVSFALFFLLSLAIITLAVKHQSIGWAVLAGVAVGVAWNTKYHGFFAIVIAAIALVPYYWQNRNSEISFERLALIFIIITVVALILYLPWALYVQFQRGGYLTLAQYQRTNLDKRWLRNLIVQVQNQLFLEGPFSRSSILISLFFAGLVVKKISRFGIRFLIFICVLMTLSIFIGSSGTAALFTIFSIPALINTRSSFPAWLALCWTVIWALMTPLYVPYARLVLPFSIASYLTGSLGIYNVLERLGIHRKPILREAGLSFMIIVSVIVAGVTFYLPDPSNPWAPSRSVAELAEDMQLKVPPGSRVIVIGEPELAFYLHISNRQAFESLGDPNELLALNQPVFIVTGIYTRRAPALRAAINRVQNQLELLGTYQMRPKDIRILDDFPPRKAVQFQANPDNSYSLTLYRLDTEAVRNP